MKLHCRQDTIYIIIFCFLHYFLQKLVNPINSELFRFDEPTILIWNASSILKVYLIEDKINSFILIVKYNYIKKYIIFYYILYPILK